MFGRKYTQDMLDRAESVESIAEAAYILINNDPQKITGGIRYTKETLDTFGVEPTDIGMDAPQPNWVIISWRYDRYWEYLIH